MATQNPPMALKLEREPHFNTFVTETLMPFWQQRQEWQFIGVDDIPIQCVRFTADEHDKAVVIVSGFLESYIKYQEVIYDFFNNGYDVFMFDHRGQGFSGRMLEKSEPVYVERFSDYVDDLSQFWHDNVASAPYRQRYLLGHSMGGAITSLFLARSPKAVNAVVLSAPMAGIKLPIPYCCATLLVNISQRYDFLRKSCVFKRKTPLPFKLNLSCNSECRYQYFIDLYYQYPQIQLCGPTYQWVKEAMAAGKQMRDSADLITAPLLLLQAGKENLVSNPAQLRFIDALRQAGNLRPGEGLTLYKDAAHEILFDHDAIREQALQQIFYFFEQYQ
jgi:lysophospholipase